MDDEVDMVYNTRLRRQSLDTDFHRRLANALANDLQRERDAEEIEESEDEDLYRLDFNDLHNMDYLPEEDASDIEQEDIIEANEILDSDDDDEGNMHDETQQSIAADDACFYGKDGTKWYKNEPSASTRFRQHNIMRFRAGPKDQNSIPIEVFKKFFTPNMAFIIITETNRYAHEATDKWNMENPHKELRVWQDLTSVELDAFIGILLAAGVSHNNMQKASVLWRSDALPIFRAAMSYKRFIALTRYIRFDDGRTREFRARSDKAAAIRDIWNYLNENLARNYEPHEAFTIDEQLFPYRGKTKFTQYIPSKPAKYGIKIWWACDSKSKYPLQGKLYTGREEGADRDVRQGENVMLQLSNRFNNTGRTVVADNFFTTLEGVKRLAKVGLAFVGTIRSNKRCVPEEMRKNRSRPIQSSLFGFHENLISICSYVPKKNRAVNLLSTVHYTKDCVGDVNKPEAILFYNANKAGVDCMDQMITHFTTKRPTKRWTFAFFCNMLDIMALAAYCICKEIDGFKKSDARRNFLTTLSNTLVLPNIENRMNNVHVVKNFNSRSAIESFFGKPIKIPIDVSANHKGADTLNKRRECKLCLQETEKTRRKTRFFCTQCTDPVCQQHSKIEYICFACFSIQPY